MAQHSCSCRFKRPPELVVAPPLISCGLLRLPTEILALIFANADQIDGVCLALTCKHLLQVIDLGRKSTGGSLRPSIGDVQNAGVNTITAT
ncbi:hypothetical protein V2G26_019092 [Clonostachys chloroleuca]